ncbi:MAG TPA: ATPase F0F1 [Chloroflexi bacterium]|jgi:ATP synthase protein I|nr:ATPase F0F1 [Chloroflexota bacterium]
MKPEQDNDRFVSAIKRQAERSQNVQKPNLWSAFGIVGTVGWMVVVPALLGVALGRYLDMHFRLGLFWTLSLLVLGLALGCMAAWRHMEEVMKP